jgi:hypothetical protein
MLKSVARMKMQIRYLMIGTWLLIASAIGAQAQVLMRGDIGYDVFGSRVFIFVEDITNSGEVETDRLRLRLWASKDHWTEEHPGRVLAVTTLPRLDAHHHFEHMDRNVHLHRPPIDWYYVTLTLEERVVAEDGTRSWQLRDAIEFDGREYLTDYSFNPFCPFD